MLSIIIDKKNYQFFPSLLYSLITPTNTKQIMPLYYKVSLAGCLSLSLAGSFSNWKSRLNPSKDIKIFKTGIYQGTQIVTCRAYVDVLCTRLGSKKKKNVRVPHLL